MAAYNLAEAFDHLTNGIRIEMRWVIATSNLREYLPAKRDCI